MLLSDLILEWVDWFLDGTGDTMTWLQSSTMGFLAWCWDSMVGTLSGYWDMPILGPGWLFERISGSSSDLWDKLLELLFGW